MLSDHEIRPLTADDEPILWRMLFYGLHPASGEAPPDEIVKRPEFARYVEGWGRDGDCGFVAHSTGSNHEAIGAVWSRSPAACEIPELAFAVSPQHRKAGVAAALLTRWVRANPEQSVVSLRVSANHPAVRLYGRFGFGLVAENEGAVLLRRTV